ncbi:MAG: AbrB/MazE/SpoVT family DNA-binding domain-containing protein [Burkholderiales bacterium]
MYILYIYILWDFMSIQSLSKWGSSLAVRLPAAFAKQMRLGEGSKVEIAIDGKRLVVVAVDDEPDAKSFFAGVKASQAQHGLVATGRPRGKEIR